MQESAANIYGYLATYGLSIIAAIIIFVVGRWLAKIISSLVARAMEKTSAEKTLVKFVRNLCYIALLIFVIIAALAKLGVQTASFIAVVGAAGLAVGLALQGSLANFAAGVLLLMFRPYKVGDFVKVAECEGTVKDIHIFNTILDTLDNRRAIIPNSKVTAGSIINYTVNKTRRVDLTFGVSYQEDLKKAHHVIEDVLANDSKVLKDPAPTVAVSELGDNSVKFAVRPWCKCEDYWNTYFDITEKVKLALDHNHISIPFPQRDIHVKDIHPEELVGAGVRASRESH